MDVVDYFTSRRTRLLAGHRSLIASALQRAPHEPGRVEREARAQRFRRAFRASPSLRRAYTLEQLLLFVDGRQELIRAKCRNGFVELPSRGRLRLVGGRSTGFVRVRLTPAIAVVAPETASRFLPLPSVHPGLDLLDYIPAAYRTLFWPGDKHAAACCSRPRQAQLGRALAALERTGVLELVSWVTGSILLFGGGRKNSFYDPRAHGSIFIRIPRACDEFHLVEEIVHQAGHAAFSALMQEPRRFLRVPTETRLRDLTFEGEDERTALVALHGLITEALVTETLQRCYAQTREPFARHQLVGRLAFATAKLAADLQAFVGCAQILGPEGTALLRAIADTCQGALRRYGDVMRAVNLKGQPYIFSQRRYLALNPQAK